MLPPELEHKKVDFREDGSQSEIARAVERHWLEKRLHYSLFGLFMIGFLGVAFCWLAFAAWGDKDGVLMVASFLALSVVSFAIAYAYWRKSLRLWRKLDSMPE